MVNRWIKTLFILGLFIIGSSLAFFIKQSANEDYEVYVDELINQFSKEVRKEYGLCCSGSGGSMPYNVVSIKVKFQSNKHATIEEARELDVKLIEKFLKLINAHEKIRPYLCKYPFPVSGAQMSISFFAPDNSDHTDGSVCYVSQTNGNLTYYTYDEPTKGLKEIFQEPYTESLKIVETTSKHPPFKL